MKQTSFEELSRIVEDIPDSELTEAIAYVQESRGSGKHHGRVPVQFADVVSQLEEHELAWLDTVLCVRAQQLGRDAAWRRFAASSYREVLPFYR